MSSMHKPSISSISFNHCFRVYVKSRIMFKNKILVAHTSLLCFKIRNVGNKWKRLEMDKA